MPRTLPTCTIPIFSYSNFLAARRIRGCPVFHEHFRQRSRRGPEGARVLGARTAGAGNSEDFALPGRKEQRHEKDRTTNDRSLVHHPAGVRVFVQPGQLSHGGRRDGENRDRSGRGRDCQRGFGGAEADQRLRHDRGRKLRERGHRLQRCFRVATEGAGRGERRHRTADLFLVDGGAPLHPAAAGRHGPGGRPAVAGAAGYGAGGGECRGADHRSSAAALRAGRGAISIAGHPARSTDRSELWIRP